VDHASLASLVTELLTTIHLLSGYPTVSVQPEIHRLPQAAIAEKVCHKPCGVRAYYRPDWGVLLDESLNVQSDSFDRSILLHGLVHHVQAAPGRFEPCRVHAIAGTRPNGRPIPCRTGFSPK